MYKITYKRHNTIRQCECLFCGKHFGYEGFYEGKLDEHIKENHLDKVPDKYKCKKCDYITIRLKDLHDHKKEKH